MGRDDRRDSGDYSGRDRGGRDEEKRENEDGARNGQGRVRGARKTSRNGNNNDETTSTMHEKQGGGMLIFSSKNNNLNNESENSNGRGFSISYKDNYQKYQR